MTKSTTTANDVVSNANLWNGLIRLIGIIVLGIVAGIAVIIWGDVKQAQARGKG